MRQYILLFILMLASLRCTAQINSSIWGLSIGSSTKTAGEIRHQPKGI